MALPTASTSRDFTRITASSFQILRRDIRLDMIEEQGQWQSKPKRVRAKTSFFS
jgi:hypothetical protein